ncbi:T-cell leukemia/lymphoma protein 1A-like [Pipistrellus kuhlii]|uniref:T-cell leukemia/lymphoma protein 1A-like n=1 Tax=Pipistrellus kuhlii TaxID=59472 RepID=UPI00174F2FB6|nr:T-cell leukemia/lymphoma protein 1A-like [Pipistrellus kuhlii]
MDGGGATGAFLFTMSRSLHSDHLWIWPPNMYMDGIDGTWMSITIETESSLQVLLCQIEVSRGEALQPSRLSLMWQLYPGRLYRSPDSSFWRIVYHIKINGVEDMFLEQLPDP